MFKVEEKNYKPILRNCFKTDEELLIKWHIKSGQGLKNCVNKTFWDLQECGARVYGLYKGNDLIGYFAEENFKPYKFLTGFFLKPEFRDFDTKKEFWNLVIEHFNSKPFYCGLYTKNIPANKFIKAHNGELVFQGSFEDQSVCLYKLGVQSAS